MNNAKKKALRIGFLAGFAAPYRFLYGGRARTVRHPNDLVSVSWQEVGTAFRRAIDTESKRIGKTF